MKIEKITSKNGYVEGIISIDQDFFNLNNRGRTVNTFREKSGEYVGVGKIDKQNMRIFNISMILFDDQQIFDFYINNGETFIHIGALARIELEESRSGSNYTVNEKETKKKRKWW